ncbi:uncharacterized protein LOC134242601 [Saccostrea cucullata]|uniref:uncharacterized protein LOC134242601 n=1 Tax=Saccostrea cuccullata TaxID=36930 RepID=UPI002ED12E60
MTFQDKSTSSILPYTCVYIDAEFKDIFGAASRCLTCCGDREQVIQDLKQMWTTSTNQNPVLPCLSVRTGLDLFLQVKNYPPGSEIIMSAINIPDMVYIVKHHGLKVVPLDVDIERTSPKLDQLKHLISTKTVAILVAHIYGKQVEMDSIIDIAQEQNLVVIEDCAECFCGFDWLGNPRSDLSLFSFGVIKPSTAFGGAIAKIRDQDLYDKMHRHYSKYPVQKHGEYFKKLTKYFMVYLLLDCPQVVKPAMWLTRTLNIDHKRYVIKMLRGFPSDMVHRIRQQPSNALLQTLRHRLKNFKATEFKSTSIKGDYVRERLPESVTIVGAESTVNNYWLYPILVENPDTVVKILNAMGIDAYRGATQLNIIEPEKWNPHLDYFAPLIHYYPHEARYLIDHVVYLPVNKSVPFHVLDQICKGLEVAIKISKNGRSVNVRPQSKLVEDITGKAFKKIKIGTTDDTGAHRLNRLYCMAFFIALTLFSSAEQFVGEPISCWCPAQFKKFHVSYANAYCWIKNTYLVPFEDSLPVDHREREDQEIMYYQWVPIIFALQAFMFFLPRMFWKHWNGYSGFDLKKVLRIADNASYDSPDERKDKIGQLAEFIDRWIDIRDCIMGKTKTSRRIKEAMASVGIHKGNFMMVFYLFTGFLYFANTLGQFFLLELLLGNNFLRIGPDFLMLMFEGKKWKDLERFPLVTYCDFDIRQLSNLQRWTVQCSLPINLFNEKLFVITWFLLVVMTLINGGHLVWNMVTFCLPWRQHHYILKYLHLSEPKHFNSKGAARQRDLVDKFIKNYLRNDGIFVIWMVSANTSQVLASELVETLWTNYCEKPTIKSYMNLEDDEIQC